MSYVITPEHFAAARATLDGREKAIKERHCQELHALEAERTKIDELERAVSTLAALPIKETVKPIRAQKRSTKRTPKLQSTLAKAKYTPEDDARLVAANPSELKDLAREMGRSRAGVEKRREFLRKKAHEEATVKDASPPADPSSSENEVISEPAADREIVIGPAHPALSSPATAVQRPARPVYGILDDGPGRGRNYDPIAFASKEKA